MCLIRNIMTVVVMVLCTSVLAQNPGWTVNPGNYQYSMTIVAFLNVDSKLLVSEQDQVAAFASGEIRGVARPILVSSTGRHLAYLTVFANKENEKIEFKIYDSASGKVVAISASISFKIDAQYGNVFQAFSIANPALNNEAAVSNFFFTGVDSVATAITDDEVDIVLEYDQDLHNLTPEFVMSKGGKMYLDRTLQASGTTSSDFAQPISYSVLSEDESVLKTYKVTVSNRQTSEDGFVSTNVVTANNDGANDHWIVQDVFKYKDHAFTIYDANGRVLFESTGYNNDWDGSYKGGKVERGIYYFTITDPDSKTAPINGKILVLH